MTDIAPSPDPDLASALRAPSDPMRPQMLQWPREPERHFPMETAITDPVEVGVGVSHIDATRWIQ
ncbi:hypothetical protein [Streptomyces sp. NPDC020362]|uniref:hypothetical protein n=1 Tax=unclassified Streptomyces TaxID=2593676 RepID=UPI0033E693BC